MRWAPEEPRAARPARPARGEWWLGAVELHRQSPEQRRYVTHSGNSQGTAARPGLALWMNGSNGTMTTFAARRRSARTNPNSATSWLASVCRGATARPTPRWEQSRRTSRRPRRGAPKSVTRTSGSTGGRQTRASSGTSSTTRTAPAVQPGQRPMTAPRRSTAARTTSSSATRPAPAATAAATSPSWNQSTACGPRRRGAAGTISITDHCERLGRPGEPAAGLHARGQHPRRVRQRQRQRLVHDGQRDRSVRAHARAGEY